jgi:hypothetical protein
MFFAVLAQMQALFALQMNDYYPNELEHPQQMGQRHIHKCAKVLYTHDLYQGQQQTTQGLENGASFSEALRCYAYAMNVP